MKKSSVLILVAALSAATFVPVIAQESAPSAERRGGGGGGGRGPNFEMLAEELSLTADQKAKVEPMFKANQEKMRALREDQSLSREDRMAKARALREEWESTISAQLTSEQKAKWSEIRERRRAGGGKGGPGGPGGREGREEGGPRRGEKPDKK